MKALIQEEVSKPLVVKTVEKPKLEKGEVLVQVKAAALNHRDVWINKGQYPGITSNIILGSDGAGVVAELGDEVDATWLGKEVIINPSHDWGDNPACQGERYKILGLPKSGTFAEYVKVKAQYLVAKPKHLSFEEAAALPLAGLTAYRALFTRAGMKKGEKVLISGVGGGVALFAFQFALAAGGKVYVTSGSPSKIERATQMGAAGGANYKAENWVQDLAHQAEGFDVTIDSAGGKGFKELVRLAAPGGRIAFYGGTRGKFPELSPQILFWKQLSILGSTMGTSEEFADMIAFVQKTKLKPVVDTVFPLEKGNEAFAHMAAGKQFGKIVLAV